MGATWADLGRPASFFVRVCLHSMTDLKEYSVAAILVLDVQTMHQQSKACWTRAQRVRGARALGVKRSYTLMVGALSLK